jgi:hypothetical protein
MDAPFDAVAAKYHWDMGISDAMPPPVVVGKGNAGNVNGVDVRDGEGRDVDVLVMQRACKPESSQLFRAKMGLLPNGTQTPKTCVGVCEFDDNLWQIDKGNYARAYYMNPAFMENLALNLTLTDAITVSTEALAHQIITFQPACNRKTYILPNQLPDWCIDLPQREHHDGSEGPVIIAYPASANHLGDVVMVGYAMQKLLKKYPTKVKYLSIGADFRKQVGIPDAEQVPWIGPMPDYYTSFSTFDICIAPILPTPFNDAKSEIKALESGRAGVPIVATNFGPYKRYVDHGEDGFLTMKEEDWFTYLRDLVFDHDMRREMGQRAREKAILRTYSRSAPTWAAFYKKLVDAGPSPMIADPAILAQVRGIQHTGAATAVR